MEVIEQNPYRIAGILANASTKELQRQKTKLKAYTKVGKEIKSDYDFEILTNISRTEESTNQAFSTIEQNHDKVNHALFWFLEASPFDKTAIEYLKNGNEIKASEIWLKITTDKEVNSKNFSALNNIGTIKLLSSNKLDIQEGIQTKIQLIKSEYFKDFVHSVADETYTIDSQKQSEILIDELLSQFKNQYSNSETLEFFNKCDGLTQQYLSKKFTEEPLHKIENQIENCKKKRKAHKDNAYEYGLGLFTKTKDDLSLLQTLLGNSNLKYKAIADQLANEIMQCGIDYFNTCNDIEPSGNHLERAKELTTFANSIAVGKLTKDRAKDSLSTLVEMKDIEIKNAITLLQSIKDAYQNSKKQILAQVKAQEATMSYNQSINYDKVNELIANSIDWDKAIELILKAAPAKTLEIIKTTSDQELISEFKKLVNFVISKLDYSRKKKILYLQYWKSNNVHTTFEILSYWPFVVIGIGAILGFANGGGLGGLFVGGLLGFFATGVFSWILGILESIIGIFKKEE